MKIRFFTPVNWYWIFTEPVTGKCRTSSSSLVGASTTGNSFGCSRISKKSFRHVKCSAGSKGYGTCWDPQRSGHGLTDMSSDLPPRSPSNVYLVVKNICMKSCKYRLTYCEFLPFKKVTCFKYRNCKFLRKRNKFKAHMASLKLCSAQRTKKVLLRFVC